MKSVAQFDIDLARVVPMETAEGLAVVEVHAAVGHVQGIQRCGDALAEVLANRKVERGVLWQMASRIRAARERVTEAGAVVDVRGCIRAPRQGNVGTDVERVCLIVVEGDERGGRRK